MIGAAPVTIEAPTRTGVRTKAPLRFTVGTILAAGATVLLLAAALTLLVATEDVPAAGHLGTAHQLIRLVAMTPLLPLGALMLTQLPRNAIGWILLIVGVVGIVLSMIFWSAWGGFGGASAGRRTTVIEE